jgi:hypothetical protein
MNGFMYKNKHSFKDFNLTIKSKNISPPKKIKIKESVPFMQGSYDFSNLYGEQTYEERQLNYVLNLQCRSKVELNTKKIKILDWLMNSFKTVLKDDAILGYYFNAECEDVEFKESGSYAEITVSFIAYPFKISLYDEGNIPWNDFNFELDYMQETKFDVVGSKNIGIINSSSKKITPTVICTAPFDLIKDGIIYKFNTGSTKDWRFNLDKGINNLTVNGNGNIEFLFRKEVL